MNRARTALLVVAFFVCPLLFFTNLTRNPYITQIVLLNAALLWGGALLLWEAAGKGPAAWPRTAVDLPLVCWLGACALSWALAYFGHRPFFRPSISAEGARAGLFLVGNALCPFFLGASLAARQDAEEDVPLGGWIVFVVVWGLAWTLFPELRGRPNAAAPDVFAHVWDGYGALLWFGGAGAALWLCRRGRWGDFLHLALAAGFLASAYGVLQYFNVEFIWPNTLNPYGGRSVSTFGNPNFLSSFNVVLLPAAVSLFSRSTGGRRAAYAALALTLEAALLCCLTRSSWLGAGVAVAALLLVPEFRAAAARDARPHGLLAAVGVGMALLWPSSSIVSGYTPSVVGRVSEVVQAARAHVAYGSLYQRLLIWSCGWLMGAENPLTGKGFGLFELFYPFYQGHIVGLFDVFRYMRTHANNGHNEIVEVFAQTGLLGLGLYAWLWTTFFRAAAPAARRGWLAAASMAGAAGMLADNLLNVSLHFAVPGFLFWFAFGSAMGAARGPVPAPRAKEPAPAAPPAWRWGLTLAGAALALLSLTWGRLWLREAHYFAGFKLLRQKGFALAVRELELSRKWGPREVNAIYELGNAYAQSERYPEAVEAYHGALDANAGYDEIYFNIGALLSSRLGRATEAIDYFRVAHWINRVSPEVYNSLGNVYLANPQQYRAEGIELLEEAVRRFPENPTHWNNLGYLYTLDKRWKDAEHAYERALTIDPTLAVAERNLQAAAQQGGLPRPAILDALRDLREVEQRALKHDYSEQTLALAKKLDARLPDNPRARFFLGSLLMARGRAAEAVPVLEWVVDKQPGHVWARMNLGEAYRALGRLDSAAAQFRAAADLDPNNALARQRLSELGH